MRDYYISQKTEAKSDNLSWFDAPEDIKNLLTLAASNWEDTSKSQYYINEALTKAQEHTDVLIAAYRYFFYKHKLPPALKVAQLVLDKIKRSEKLPEEWEKLKPILIENKDDSQIRIYLSAYAASGLILAKLGEIEKAKVIISRVKEIDDLKEFSAEVLLNVLEGSDAEDD